MSITVYDDDGNDVDLPSCKVVCPRCRGEGKHINPSIDGHGIAGDDGTLGADTLKIAVDGTGTLALSTSDALSDQAVVSMPAFGVASAKIQLAEGVEETVGWLLYGGKFKSVGTYGATGSGADHIDDTHFSGSGRLRVVNSKSGLIMSLR